MKRFFIEAKTGRAYAIYDECSLERFFREKSDGLPLGEHYEETGLFIAVTDRTATIALYIKGHAVDKTQFVFGKLSDYNINDSKTYERAILGLIQQQTGYAWQEL